MALGEVMVAEACGFEEVCRMHEKDERQKRKDLKETFSYVQQ